MKNCKSCQERVKSFREMDLFSQTICLILSKSAFYSKKCNYLYLLPRSSCVLNFWTKYYSNFCYANNRFFSSFVCVVFYGKVTKIWHKLFHRMWNFFYTTQFLSKAYYMEYIGGSDHVQVECSWIYIVDCKWILEGKLGWLSQSKFCSEIYLYMILAHVFKFS